MNIHIKKNDAFYALGISVNFKEQNRLQKKILDALLEERIIHGGNEDCGLSIQEIIDETGLYSADEVIGLIFPELKDTREAKELLPAIYIWNDLNDCPDCGCKTENNYENTAIVCTNCDYKNEL